MTDFHCHILPGVDDGSKNVEMSLEMLRMEQQMGVDTIVLTPHFYSDENSPRRFLERRARAWEKLSAALEPDMPKILLGSEVQYFEGIGHAEDISSLCIEGTNILLLEMPFCHWDDHILRTVKDLHNYGDVRIVLAHIERYMKEQPKGLWAELNDMGIRCQVNCSFFEGWLKRRKAMNMMEAGLIQFIGSDSHNLSNRKPNWDLVPDEAKEMSDHNAKRILFRKR